MTAVSDYHVFGLRIRSEEPLPSLRPVLESGAPDVYVSFCGGDDRDSELPESGWLEEEAVQFYPALGFVISSCEAPRGTYLNFFYAEDERSISFYLNPDVSRVWIYWTGDVWLEEIHIFLLGPVMGRLLRRKGRLCFHANTISVDDSAVVFAGQKGAGKSTITAFLVALGYPLVSDDISVLNTSGGTPGIVPGLPRIRLERNVASMLVDSTQLKPVWRRGRHRPDKVYLELDQFGLPFCPQQVALRCIYLLRPRSREESSILIESVSGPNQLIGLLTNTYGEHKLNKEIRSLEFETLSRLALKVPIRSVSIPEGLDSLRAACDDLVQDVCQLPPL